MIYKKFKKLSVAKQFLFSALSAILLIVLLFSGYMIATSIDSKNAQFEIMANGRSSGVIEKIDRNFYERFGDVQAFAVNKLATESTQTKKPTEELQRFINTMVAYYVLYDLMLICDNEGKVLAANTTDKNGRGLKTDFLIGKDFSNYEWYRMCTSGKGPEGGAWYSDFIKNEDVAKIYGSNGYGMAFAAPIKNDVGEVIGVWYNFSNWNDVTSGIRRETEEVLKNSNPGAFILITNASNQVIDSDDSRLILTEQISIENIQAGATFRFQGKEISLDNFVMGGKKGVGAYTFKGKNWNAITFIPKTKFTFSFLVQHLLGLLLTVALFICFISVLLYRLAISVSRNIQELEMSIEVLATGSLVDIKDSSLENELGSMVRALKKLIVGLRSTAKFAQQIGNGELLADYTPMGENDTIGNSLLAMRQSLAKIKEEDEQRTWVNQGIAKMGNILQHNYSQASQLYDTVLKFVVNYSKCIQGGLYLINDGEPDQLSMVACYAYERKKFLEKHIKVGEGLIGQCFLEQETIYITSLPKNYTTITSGLGNSTPISLIIIPLKVNDSMVGVMELASLTNCENHERALLEKFAESMAATVIKVRMNERTKQLLVQSQQQTEEMRAQEEEMRQNMEELTATQEEMARKEKEYQTRIEELEKQLQTARAKWENYSLQKGLLN